MLRPVLDVAVSVPLLSTAEIKLHSKVDTSDDDTLIDSYVSAATSLIEKRTGRKLLNQTWSQSYGGFETCLRLPFEPVSEILSVKYYDADNVLQTVSASDYKLLTDREGPFVTTTSGNAWPASHSRDDSVTVQFVAGYGATASDVEEDIKQVARLIVSTWLENRETVVVGVSVNEMPIATGVQGMLESYRKNWVS